MYLTYQLLICGCRGFKYRPVFRELWHCSNQLLTQTPQCSHSGGCNDKYLREDKCFDIQYVIY